MASAVVFLGRPVGVRAVKCSTSSSAAAAAAAAPLPSPASFPDVRGLSLPELQRVLASRSAGLREERARDVFRALYRKTGQGKAVQEVIIAALQANKDESLVLVDQHIASDGTRKLVCQAGRESHSRIETVIIPETKRTTICVSSQVGCAMSCKFCHTALMGLHRHLSASQIVQQVMIANNVLQEAGEPLASNIVYMGMGEPLDNVDSVLQSFDILTEPYGFAIPPRKVCVSTSGLIPEIRQLVAHRDRLRRRPQLAVSLNASNQETRKAIMPVSVRYPIDELLACLSELFPRTSNGQVVLLEYVMLENVNDSLDNALELAQITKDIKCKINLIEFNSYPGAAFAPSSTSTVDEFRRFLTDHGLLATVRHSRGDDSMAACGQLGRTKEKLQKFVP